MILITASALLLSQPSAGSTSLPDGRAMTVYGVGSDSCAQYLSAQADDEESVRYEDWALGYLSGFNSHGPLPDGNVVGSFETEEVLASMKAYCSSHPLAPWLEAVEKTIIELRERAPRPR